MATLHRDLIVTLAARHKLPAVYFERYFVAAGGLISYGPDLVDQYRRAAGYVDRILKGEKPAFAAEQWLTAVNDNMVAAIELIRALIDGMIERRFGRIVNITSSTVKSPIADLSLSTAARLGLTGYTAGVSRQVAQHNVTINNILPGWFDTDRFRSGVTSRAKATASRTRSSSRASTPPCPQGASATRPSSAMPAPGCAAAKPATSPARTCCWMAGSSPARSRCSIPGFDGAPLGPRFKGGAMG